METPTLKPLSIAELLDKAFQLYRSHTILMLSIFAVVLIPAFILSAASTYFFNDSRIVDSLIVGLSSIFAELAAVYALSRIYLYNEQITLKKAFQAGSRFFGSRIGANILMGLAFVPIGAFLVMASLTGSYIIAVLLFIPLMAFFSTRWSLSTPAIVLEGKDASKSLGRSWSLTSDYFWRVFGTSFAAGILSTLLSTLPSLFVGFLLQQSSGVSAQISLIITNMIEQIASIFASPMVIAVNVLIYYDLRVRKEAFDLELMAQQQQQLETV
ncbi:MAG TPA: glycerophosphoryl diester phosphodiesterase membrane domain-containing protein [Anaerolineales bacterium]|nr:glycerophosphoryl diester phosphodiesterase membrane domain-containing protein [Anaerolineales bacterium]